MAAVDMYNLSDNEIAEMRDKDECRIQGLLRIPQMCSDILQTATDGLLNYWQTDNIYIAVIFWE